MSITMYDSDTPADIPANVAAVAGYPDLWPESAWDRFPTRYKVRIARSANQNDGHALDVESTLATPAQAPNWVRMRLATTSWPAVGVYVNRSNWQATYDACRGQPVRWWVSTLDGTLNPPGPATPLAVQYAGQFSNPPSGGHYDLSACDPAFFNGWFGDSQSQEEAMLIDNGPDLGVWLLAEGFYVYISNPTTLDNFVKAGLKKIPADADLHLKLLASRTGLKGTVGVSGSLTVG